MEIRTNLDSNLVRAFVAVELPEHIRDQVIRLISRLSRNYPAVRWVGPAGLHLTVLFLGENPPDFIERVRTSLAPVSSQVTGFTLSLSNLGVFPDSRAPRVIWVGVDKGRAELVRLAEGIQHALLPVGFVPERRPFSPHLTLGRARQQLSDVDRLLHVEFATTPFPVSGFTLFRSVLRPSGAVHERLAEYALGS